MMDPRELFENVGGGFRRSLPAIDSGPMHTPAGAIVGARIGGDYICQSHELQSGCFCRHCQAHFQGSVLEVSSYR